MFRCAAPLSLVFFFPLASLAAESDKDALAIVDKAIEAHGAEKFAKAKAQSWKTKGKMTVAGMTIEFKADYTFAGPDKFRFDVDMDAGGMKIKFSVGTNGKLAWEQSGPELRDMPKDKQTEFHHNIYVMYLSQITPLKDKAYKLSALGESKVGDQAVVGVKVSREGHRDVSMYFDKKTGLMAKFSTRIIDEFSMKEVTQDTFATGYRELEGRKIYDKLTIHREGKEVIVEEFSDQKLLDKVDEKLFAKPAK